MTRNQTGASREDNSQSWAQFAELLPLTSTGYPPSILFGSHLSHASTCFVLMHFTLSLCSMDAADSSEQLGTFKDFIKTFPEIDTPEIFGLHPNADLTFRVKEVNALFGTLGNTQPKVHSNSYAVLLSLAA